GQLLLAARAVEDILRYVTADRQSGTPEQPSAEAPVPVDRHSPVYPALVYIDAHLDQRIGLEEMAALCGLSCSYFSRVFCRDVGEGFRDYLNRRRIEEAKALLEKPGATVSQVSDRLGFTDISYFVKVFKKYEGITPKSYIQRMSRQ
ncbi:MAG: helix-turn-helix transcriptional regulator, partial [Clostridia bacterium]|nr:helix-turn-helix transcriptional regulator [Clostridia bacterium]